MPGNIDPETPGEIWDDADPTPAHLKKERAGGWGPGGRLNPHYTARLDESEQPALAKFRPPSPTNTPYHKPGNPIYERPSSIKNRPSQGDEVLVSFMDGGKRPEIARQAGAQPLASDDEEEEGSAEVGYTPAHDISGPFSAEEIELCEKLGFDVQRQADLDI